MSVSAEQVEKFFETKGNDDTLNTTLRQAIPEPPPEPVVETTTEPVKEPVKAAEPDKPIAEVKFVPLEALQEERAEKKQMRDELVAYRKWQEQVNEQLKRIPAQEQAQAPDPQTDPFGYQNWALQQLGANVQEVQQWRQQQEQERRSQAQTQQVLNWATNQANIFTAKEPEYPNAYKFASDARDKEYQAMGVTDPGMRAQLIEQDTARVINHAVQNNLNPAELIFNFAKVRGFAAKSQATQALDPNASAKIAAGQAAAPKLDKGGQTADSEITFQDLANIRDPVEFEKQWAKKFKK